MLDFVISVHIVLCIQGKFKMADFIKIEIRNRFGLLQESNILDAVLYATTRALQLTKRFANVSPRRMIKKIFEDELPWLGETRLDATIEFFLMHKGLYF